MKRVRAVHYGLLAPIITLLAGGGVADVSRGYSIWENNHRLLPRFNNPTTLLTMSECAHGPSVSIDVRFPWERKLTLDCEPLKPVRPIHYKSSALGLCLRRKGGFSRFP